MCKKYVFIYHVLINILSLFDNASSLVLSTSTRAPHLEIERRRNVAIISHPDSGKTTMTEKLLLYGGALQQAGAVRQKANQRGTASDFMEMEKERGISISATVMNFEYEGLRVNILDTPGHADFSEDTYRALTAADNAVMLIDGAKGLEPQTKKLFSVVRMNKIPLFTFVNKMDRPALSPYQIMDEIEQEFGLETHPIIWPIGDGDRFRGVLDRMTNKVFLYERGGRGKKANEQKSVDLSDLEGLKNAINDDELLDKLLEDAELLNEILPPLDEARILDGSQSPLFFGSAMTNFGVSEFLNYFCSMGSRPLSRVCSDKEKEIKPEHDEFTGFIFKTQANLDPKHRDRLAYIRIVSGMYEKQMAVGHSRSKPSKKYNLNSAQSLFGNHREIVDIAYPGDVIGSNFAIGDTLYTGSKRIAFPPIPSFSPEVFAYLTNPNPSSYKSFQKGIDQLLQEGCIQSFRQRGDDQSSQLGIILGAVGQLQFDVVQARLKNEYNAESTLEFINYSMARWVEEDGVTNAWEEIHKVEEDGKLFGVMIVQDVYKRPVLLFRNEWKIADLNKDESLNLVPWCYPPDLF